MEKSRFSKYAILSPVKHSFAKEPKLFWTIRPSTSRDELAMTVFSTTEGSFLDAKGEKTIRYPNIIEITWRELATLFGGTNIPTSEIPQEELDKCVTQEDVDKLYDALPRLNNDATIDQIEALLGDMPHAMVREAWFALGEANPGWGPRKDTPEKKLS
jgi:hypothetical protein